MAPTAPFVTLSNGVKMPQLGFGLYEVPPGETAEKAVLAALQAGYRLIDTAAAYLNEKDVGKAIRASGVPRGEIFVATKLWVQDTSYEGAKKAFQTSLDKLGLDYLDLYLIHQPFNDYYGAWRALEELYEAGKVRAIGVCNFDEARLADLVLHNRVVPAIDQVELHPFFHQKGLSVVAEEYGVRLQSWGPLVQGRLGVFTNETLSKIAAAHGKTIAQVCLRWGIQKGAVVIPRSIQKAHVEENMDVWDFSLSEAEMKEIEPLDIGYSKKRNHHSAEMVKFVEAFKIHE